MDERQTEVPPEDTGGEGATGDPDETAVTPPDEAGTVVTPPDEAATQVNDAVDDPTRVMAGAPEPPTRVMSPPPASPLSGPAAPPMGSPATVSPRRSGGDRLWLWVILAIAVVAALLAAWYVLGRSGSDGEAFIGTWMPADGSPGGLVIKENGSDFTVVAYDDQLQKAASSTARLEDGDLVFQMDGAALGDTSEAGVADVTVSHDDAADQLTAELRASQGHGVVLHYVRTDVLQQAAVPPAAPSQVPTPTPSLTPTPTGSPTGSPSPSADQLIMAAVDRIRAGVTTWASKSGNMYPAPSEVTQTGGVAQYVVPWPTNPLTDQPMVVGTQQGDYQYQQLDAGQGYELTGYLGNNLVYKLP